MNNLIDILDDVVDYAGKRYEYVVVMMYLIYAILFFGIININPEYIDDFRWGMQTFVCLFLLYRFNPFRKQTHVLRQYDAKIIFSSALFLLVNTGLAEIFERHWKEIPTEYIPDIPIDYIAELPYDMIIG